MSKKTHTNSACGSLADISIVLRTTFCGLKNRDFRNSYLF